MGNTGAIILEDKDPPDKKLNFLRQWVDATYEPQDISFNRNKNGRIVMKIRFGLLSKRCETVMEEMAGPLRNFNIRKRVTVPQNANIKKLTIDNIENGKSRSMSR